MRILMLLSHEGLVRNFEWTLKELTARGHEVTVGLERPRPAPADTLERLRSELPALDIRMRFPKRAGDPWYAAGRALRVSGDYLRYTKAPLADAPLLRSRVGQAVSRPVEVALSSAPARTRAGREVIRRVLLALDRSIPSPRTFEQLGTPDAIVISPLVDLGSTQVDVVRWARRRGIPTVFAVASWDNLLTRGSIHEAPDAVAVWHAVQAEQAVADHRVPQERVHVVGPAALDHWLGARPSGTAEAFRDEAGLPADGPYVLYACSSPSLTPNELQFAARWIRRVREEAWLGLEALPVLVRPHPLMDVERDPGVASLGALENVAVWPKTAAEPSSPAFRQRLIDSVLHSAAVVGVNTTVLLEASLAGHPVLAVPAPEYAVAQTGAPHFAMLQKLAPNLHVATAWLEHAPALAECLAGTRAGLAPSELAARGAPGRLVDLIETTRPLRYRRPRAAFLLRPLAWAVGAAGSVYLRRARSRDRAPEMLRVVRKALPARALGSLAPIVARVLPELRPRLERIARQRERRPGPRPEQAAVEQPGASSNDPMDDILSGLERKAKPGAEIVFGPWAGSVEFELLVWIPFLRHVFGMWPDLQPGAIVVSRGGVAHWYEALGAAYVDLGAFVAYPHGRLLQDAFAAGRRDVPDGTPSELDREVARLCRLAVSPRATAFSPTFVLEAFDRLRTLDRLGELERYLEHAPLAAQERDRRATVGIGFGNAFHRDATNVGKLRLLGQVCARDGSTKTVGDERLARMLFSDLPEVLIEEPSLEAWTRAIAGSEFYVGPYCGLAATAVMSGVDAYCLAEPDDRLEPWFAAMLGGLGSRQGFGELRVADARDPQDVARLPITTTKAMVHT